MKTALLKIYTLCNFLILGVGLLQCGIYGKGDPVREVTEAIDRGNFSEAVRKAEGYMSSGGMDSGVMAVLDSLIDLTGRLRIDFRLTETEVRDQLVHLLGSPFTDDAFREWERSGLLEWRNIDGEKRYFARAASNLITGRERCIREKQNRLMISPALKWSMLPGLLPGRRILVIQ